MDLSEGWARAMSTLSLDDTLQLTESTVTTERSEPHPVSRSLAWPVCVPVIMLLRPLWLEPLLYPEGVRPVASTPHRFSRSGCTVERSTPLPCIADEKVAFATAPTALCTGAGGGGGDAWGRRAAALM